jgi:RNA polymerase sigma factor (sigma-70 family)
MENSFNQNMVAAFNKGDKKFVTKWYKMYYDEIVKRVCELTVGSPDTLDLVSETVAIMLERKGAFETVKNIENYLDKVIETICTRYKERNKTKKTNSRYISEHLKNLAEKSREKAVVRDKYRKLRYLATEMLPNQCLQVFNLSYHEGLRNREIAQLLNISEKAVEHHKSTAFKKLRIKFDNLADGNPSIFMFVISAPVFVIYLLIQKLLS